MSRPKRNIKFTKHLVSGIQEYMDLDATIEEYQKRYYNPELSDFLEAQNACANSLIKILAKELNIKGNPDMEQVEQDYDYYANLPKFSKSGVGCIKSEYRRNEDNI